MHHEVALHLHGETQIGQILALDHCQKRGAVGLRKQALQVGQRPRHGWRVENEQRNAGIIGKQAFQLGRSTGNHVHVQPTQHLAEQMGIVQAVGDE